MCKKIYLKKMETPAEIEEFWIKKKDYEKQDIFPNLEEKNDELKEIVEWFESKEYYNVIMRLHYDIPKNGSGLQFAFFLNKDMKYIGFIMYKIYTQEDGKCFVLDFCIKNEYRNQGLGTQVIDFFEKYVYENEEAIYIALNASNDSNARFWKRVGFSSEEVDEYGEVIFRKNYN